MQLWGPSFVATGAWWLPPWPSLSAPEGGPSKTAKHHQALSIQKTSCFLFPMEATYYLDLKQIVINQLNIQGFIILFANKFANRPFLDNPSWKPWLLMVAQNLEALLESLVFRAPCRAPGIRIAIWSNKKNCLVVQPPLWKIWTSIGMISNQIDGKTKLMFQTTNQTLTGKMMIRQNCTRLLNSRFRSVLDFFPDKDMALQCLAPLPAAAKLSIPG